MKWVPDGWTDGQIMYWICMAIGSFFFWPLALVVWWKVWKSYDE